MVSLANPTEWLLESLNIDETGTRVTAKSLLKLPAFWYGVNRICSHIGQLPVDLKRSLNRGSETVYGDYRWRLLRKRPNAYQIPAVFKEQMTQHFLVSGDARAYKATAGSRILELLPIQPTDAVTYMVEGEKIHLIKVDKDSRLRKYIDPDDMGHAVLFDEEVVHLTNLSVDGITGEKLYELAAETIKSGLSADKRTSKAMGKGFVGKLMLEAPQGSMRNPKDAQEFLTEFKKRHEADKDGDEVGMLREGIKANVLNMANTDAQFIEQRAFARQEAALWFLLESIIGDDSSVSYNSLEQKTLAYLQNTLNRWLRRWEEELDLKCLSEKEQDSLYFKFNTGPLLRSDLPTTLNALNIAVQARIMSPNEAREKLDMNPYDGGDDYFNPAITPGNGSGSSPKKEGDAKTGEVSKTGATEKTAGRQLSIAETVQKIYLGVGKVVTSDEARGIINQETGADLQVPGPEFSTIPDQTQTAARAAIVNRLQHLLGIEEQRVNDALGKTNPMKKVEAFYSRWQKTLGDAVEEMGGERQIAVDHCTESVEALLTGADVHRAVNSAEELADLILKEDE